MELLVLAFWGLLFLTVSAFYMKKIMFMLVDGEITFVQGLGYLGAYFVLFILFFTVPVFFKTVIIFLVGGFNFLLEPIKRYINKEENNAIYMRKIMECDKHLLENPYAWGTLSQKAYYYFKIKDYDKAIEIQTKVVSMSKNDMDECKKLKTYQKYYDKILDTDVRCWYCGRMVPRGVPTCGFCGHSMNLGQNVIDWLKKGGYKEIIVNTAGLILIVFLYKFMLAYVSENLRFLIHIITAVIIGICIVYSIYTKED